MNQHQLALKVFNIVQHVSILVAFGVFVWSIHVAFAIHHLVEAPVNYRTTGNANLEYFILLKHHLGSHKTAKAPSVHTNSSRINVRQLKEVLNATHLIGHLVYTKVAVNNAFEIEATICRTTIINGEHDVSLLSHMVVPKPGSTKPSVGNQLSMRSTVNINNHRIFLGRIKIDWLNHAAVKIGRVVSCLYGKDLHLGHFVCSEWIFSLDQLLYLLASKIRYAYPVWNSNAAISVDKKSGSKIHLRAMHAGSFSQPNHLLRLKVYLAQVHLQRTIDG